MLDLTKKYETHDGQPVRFLRAFPEADCDGTALTGQYQKSDGEWYSCMWNAEGIYAGNEWDWEPDLVEVEERSKTND